jgi:hypothetical protein
LEKFLVQAVEEKSPINETLKGLGEIAGVEIPASEMETYVSKMAVRVEEEDGYGEDEDIFETVFSEIEMQ